MTEAYGMRLGSLKMLKGASPLHVTALFFAAFFGIAVKSIDMNVGEALIFGELPGVVESDFGRLVGMFSLFGVGYFARREIRRHFV